MIIIYLYTDYTGVAMSIEGISYQLEACAQHAALVKKKLIQAVINLTDSSGLLFEYPNCSPEEWWAEYIYGIDELVDLGDGVLSWRLNRLRDMSTVIKSWEDKGAARVILDSGTFESEEGYQQEWMSVSIADCHDIVTPVYDLLALTY
jgi:hypothetical protein